ncbi:MAG: phosphoribosyltransferase family protein, partial [Planctomycetota bacterium]
KKAKKILAQHSIHPDIVVPVPDTSRPAAIALAEELKIPFREALIKNRYIYRSFILNSQAERERIVELKLNPVKSEIEGKHLLLVDDSIVRGTTSKRIIDLLKRNGAKSVTLASTCPPIQFPCYYGIDFPTEKELIANGKNEQEIAHLIGAEQVIYLDIQDLKTAIGLSDLCMACLDKKYPTSVEEGAYFGLKRRGTL